MPIHQNGMYGLHQAENNFNAFTTIKSLPNLLKQHNIRTGLIGKKHVGPSETFKFDYEETEENHSINQVGRNITKIKLLVRDFLEGNKKDQPFFLMISFHDPHRCGHITPQYGSFCERFGSGEEGMGLIPDWHPIYYQWEQVELPYYVPDTEPARRDIAAQYTTISRLDQGVGLVLKELKDFLKDTLIVYTSDNGPPFPAGRTNFYDPGLAEPMFISSPYSLRKNEITSAMVSHLDILPTFLDWFNITYNDFHKDDIETNEIDSLTNSIKLTGKSLLPLLDSEPPINEDDAIFASQNFHEVTMNYPMRAIRTRRYKLIHNLNYQSFFPIDQDFYVSPTFQDILNRTLTKQPLPWYKNLNLYYRRTEWELYDIKKDPYEMKNLINNKQFNDVRAKLEKRLNKWLEETNDPWICAPHAVLENKGFYKDHAQCLTLAQPEF